MHVRFKCDIKKHELCKNKPVFESRKIQMITNGKLQCTKHFILKI